MSDKLSSEFVILFLRRYDNQTLKIVIQDMEMTAKELRWKVMKVKLEFTKLYKMFAPPCLLQTASLVFNFIVFNYFLIIKILRLTSHISPSYTTKT